MSRWRGGLAAALLFMASAVRAQTPDEFSLGYVEGYFTDAGRLAVSPLHWDGGDWITAGLVVGGTAGFYTADTAFRNLAQRNQTPAGTSAAGVAQDFGNGFYVAPALAAVYAYGHFADDGRARRAGLYGLESFAISGLFVTVIKDAAGRSRPYTGADFAAWNGLRSETSETSFPSGHAQTAFAWATVIANEYADVPAVPVFAYTIAGATAAARVYGNYHWSSDVLFGSALGYFTAKAVLRYHGAKGRKVALLPFTDGRTYGLSALCRFD